MRLRQVVLAARDLEQTVSTICKIFGVEVAFRDPGVAYFGLQNAVLPFGDTFLEVISPVTADAPARRFLDRKGRDGGYMLMVQCDDYAASRRRADELKQRIVWSIELEDISGMHLHPRDTGGTLLSLDQPLPPSGWRWAGPEWQNRIHRERVSEITAAEILAPDPAALAQRWSALLDRPSHREGEVHIVSLDRGALRFRASTSSDVDGLSGIEVRCTDPARVLRAAQELDCARGKNGVEICGVHINLV